MAIFASNTLVHDLYVAGHGTPLHHASGTAYEYPNPNPVVSNNRFFTTPQPFGLGAGKSINSTGRYVYQPEHGSAVAEFYLLNIGPDPVYAGVNLATSGSWSIANGLAIAPGSGYIFGSEGSDVIRDVWAIADSGNTGIVQGYATNL